jgi:hypothetical protein
VQHRRPRHNFPVHHTKPFYIAQEIGHFEQQYHRGRYKANLCQKLAYLAADTQPVQ